MKIKNLKFNLVLLMFSIFLIASCRETLNNYTSYPKDETLESKFYANRADFDELIKFFQEDSKIYLINPQKEISDFDRNKIEIESSRLDEYKRLFSKLNVQQISRNKYNQEIVLRVWGIPNFFIGGKSKYYVFTKTPPQNFEVSLDDIYESGSDSNDYKKIGENWYLYLDVW